MERLTTHKNENYNQPGCNDCSAYRWNCCQESGEINDCTQRLTWLRLLAIEDILGDEYDLGRLRELMKADTPVRHGKWIAPHWRNDVSAANCSECGVEAHHREYRGVQKYYKVCPSCGAIMDAKERK